MDQVGLHSFEGGGRDMAHYQPIFSQHADAQVEPSLALR